MVKISSSGSVLMRENKIACTCYMGCPESIIGNQCGELTQTCGVGKNTSGQPVVTREQLFEGTTCKEHILVLSYSFGFSNDRVDFYAFVKGETGGVTIQEMGSTGCVAGSGAAAFTLPPLSIGIRVVSTFACLSSQSTFNSSIDAFTITCV